MKSDSKGLHHISIISGDPQVNAEFYVKTLGLRFVLKTVNQDDPGTYHLFYANGSGKPGSSITFFPWPRAVRSETGTGEAVSIAFSVPVDSASFWQERFKKEGIDFQESDSFGASTIQFEDPDGLDLELVLDKSADTLNAWGGGSVPAEFGIGGFWGTTLRLAESEPTIDVLEQVMGYRAVEKDGKLSLLKTDSPIGHSLIIETTGTSQPGKSGRGTVHHVAFRAKDEEEQLEMRRKVIELGLSPTTVVDRHVFKSVYFHSPGGVLFEIATDGPGYASAVDDEKEMGEKLFLPPWFEQHREQITRRLPEIKL